MPRHLFDLSALDCHGADPDEPGAVRELFQDAVAEQISCGYSAAKWNRPYPVAHHHGQADREAICRRVSWHSDSATFVAIL